MFEKLIDEWAESEGFQGFKVDHSAVLRNLGKWLDRHIAVASNTDFNMTPPTESQVEICVGLTHNS